MVTILKNCWVNFVYVTSKIVSSKIMKPCCCYDEREFVETLSVLTDFAKTAQNCFVIVLFKKLIFCYA